jgi:hypothetical protein
MQSGRAVKMEASDPLSQATFSIADSFLGTLSYNEGGPYRAVADFWIEDFGNPISLDLDLCGSKNGQEWRSRFSLKACDLTP